MTALTPAALAAVRERDAAHAKLWADITPHEQTAVDRRALLAALDELRAENERLRAALVKIAEATTHGNATLQTYTWIRNCATAALAPREGEAADTDWLQRRGRDTTLECAAIRLLDSIAKLGEFEPASKLTYFEESPATNGECHKRWVELNDAGALVRRLLAHRKDSERFASESGVAHE